MQPSPRADTSKLFFPSFRFSILVLRDAAHLNGALRLRRHNVESAIRRAKFLPKGERHERTNWRLQSPARKRLRSVPRRIVSDNGGQVRGACLQRAVER